MYHLNSFEKEARQGGVLDPTQEAPGKFVVYVCLQFSLCDSPLPISTHGSLEQLPPDSELLRGEDLK